MNPGALVLIVASVVAACNGVAQGAAPRPSQGAQAARTETKTKCTDDWSALPAPVPPAAQQCPGDPVFGGRELQRGRVEFLESEKPLSLDVEIARTTEERTRGLMYRRHLPEMSGMIFDFTDEPERVHSFWMRNTCIPLDMLFIARDGRIVGIAEAVPTMNDASRNVRCPSSWVLEVNAGWSRRHGVRPGQTVRLPSL